MEAADKECGYTDPMKHPASGTNDAWKKQIGAKGPIGFLIQSVFRAGAKLSKDFDICKPKEQRISLPDVPYQYIKDLVGAMGRRARTQADRSTKYSKLALKEIDYDATRRAKDLCKEDEGFLKTIQNGGGLAMQDLAKLDADLEPICTYCGEDNGSLDHVILDLPCIPTSKGRNR